MENSQTRNQPDSEGEATGRYVENLIWEAIRSENLIWEAIRRLTNSLATANCTISNQKIAISQLRNQIAELEQKIDEVKQRDPKVQNLTFPGFGKKPEQKQSAFGSSINTPSPFGEPRPPWFVSNSCAPPSGFGRPC